MSNSNIFSCMIDENKEKQELINDIMKGWKIKITKVNWQVKRE
jgi:MarR-like DNA-binding transcriptional regulator SgrR of sgrS sRNA